jgi:outer membrane receptor protein involved in Fe transport
VIPYFLTGDAVRADMTFGGLIRSGALNNQQFVAGGALAPLLLGGVTGNAATRLGGDGIRYDASLKAPLRSHQLFGRLDYQFSDQLRGYVEIAGNRKRNEIFANWPTLANVQIDSRDAYLSTAVTSQYAANTTFNFSKMINTAPRLNPEIDETQFSVQAGLDGHLGKYLWDVAYVYGNAVLDNKEIANVNNLRLAAALDAVTNTSGQTVCKVTRDNPGVFPGCVPLNVFGPGAESADALNYILGNPTYKATTAQHALSASINGEPFTTWAGPLKAALSAEWRRQNYKAASSDPPIPFDCAGSGLRFNCTGLTYADPNNPTSATRLIPQYANSFSSRSPVSQTVSEGALEFDAPLLAGVPLVKSLNFNGAVRFTHYDTSGSYTTWKAGLDWHISDSFRFRGTRSRDIRAPTLDDLFSPFYGQVVSVQDVLLGTTSNAYRFELGNANLKAEVGNTTTLGIVFQPQTLPGFSASLDYYDISITDAISQIQGTNPVFQRACYNSGGSSPYCSLQLRTLGNFSAVATNTVTQWRSGFLNISAIRTHGADLELNYSTKIGSHPLALRALATYQPHIYYDTPGLVTVDQAGVAFGPGGLQASPSTRVSAMLHYGITNRFSADVLTRQRGSLAMTGDPSLITTGQKVPAVSYTNLTLNYGVPQGTGKLDVYLNVQNLFNEPAPPANVNSTPVQIGLLGGFAIGDDPIGRYYSLGLRFKFGG